MPYSIRIFPDAPVGGEITRFGNIDKRHTVPAHFVAIIPDCALADHMISFEIRKTHIGIRYAVRRDKICGYLSKGFAAEAFIQCVDYTSYAVIL